VRDTCEAQDWNLIEKETEHEYEDLVLEHGFPGPQAHRYAYTTLKERAIDALLREAKESREQEVVFLTGVRRSESRNRMGSADVINKRGSQVWAAPIIYWDALDVTRWIRDHDIERSPVVDKLHMSGECLCGAFATRGEFEQIEMFYPEVAERIERLEDKARSKDRERCRWGWANRRQGGESDDATDYFMPLCKDCEAADDAEQ
jgi:3'-phosphoadenosine 5'-phosphosulfate sulfotransferase (PAPS reductase)/FAD synthetase